MSGVGSNNREKTHCPRGHVYDAVNTLKVHVGGGYIGRGCKTCRLAATRRYKARKLWEARERAKRIS